jgi:polysaccharide export outer membrane protein
MRLLTHGSWGAVPTRTGFLACLLTAALAPGRVPAEPYRLAPGDVLDVIVAGEPDLSSGPVGILVGPDGRLGIPTLGLIEAAGKTCDEVAEAIRQGLEGRILVQPQVMVRLQKHNQGVSVLGFVANPSRVPILAGSSRLSEVLAAAGGVAPGEGSTQRVIVTRATGEVIEANLTDVLKGAPQADIAVQPGDVVYVPHTEQEANVLGYVVSAGKHSINEGDRVSDLVARAGGPLVARTDADAEGDLAAVLWLPADGPSRALDLRPGVAEEDGENADPLVRPGDAIFVPQARVSVSVLGSVTSPGRVLLRPGNRVSDALAAAGGPLRATQVPAETAGADLASAQLYRAGGEVVALHLDRLYSDPQRFDDLPLAPGDVILVPEGRNLVRVVGYVAKPGEYPFRPGTTVGGAVALAGGPLANIGSPSRVRVRHVEGTEESVDLERDDPPVQPGDVLDVPYMQERVVVAGAVTRPGVLDWHAGDTVVSVLARAEGPAVLRESGAFRTEKGAVSRVAIVRPSGDRYRVIQVDLRRFYRAGDPAGNPAVEAGDVVFVPAKGAFNFETLTRDLLLLTGLLR